VNGGRRFYGKHRGVVTDTADPEGLGRVRALVADVLEGESGWALPSLPFAGVGAGFFAVPPTGANVWIEFESGDTEFPIWSGGYWPEAGSVPVPGPTPDQKVVIRTTAGHSITLDGTPGESSLTLATATGARITLSDSGVEITNGVGASVRLEGPTVSVNDGALEVT
jgi:uncharacterized protein involved in type VI secretion and phage assembly